MTLIVGFLCEDGVVVGCDDAATLGTIGQRTVRQPIDKLSIIDGDTIVGTSGPVGLGQRFATEVEKRCRNHDPRLRRKHPHEAMVILGDGIKVHAMPEIRAAAASIQALGPAAQSSALSMTVVAMPINGEPCLFSFDHQGAPERMTPDLPFVAIGSGQSIADPIISFLRGLVSPDRQPTIPEGILLTT